jgi:ABC-type lipoprotein release transport system permease subunit
VLRPARTALAAAGIAAASVVVGTAVTVGWGLGTGFERSAERADLPDVIARFSEERVGAVDERVRALPNLAARSYRFEWNGRRLRAGGHATDRGALHIVLGGRRGYAIVDGHDLSPAPGEVVIERGLADEWGLAPGDRLRLGRRLGSFRVVGVAVSPDNVAFPLASAPRVYVGAQEIEAAIGWRPDAANLALLWLNDPAHADVTLTQARAVSFGLGRLEFVTREGVRVLLSQAAGIVISLLVAFSLVALVGAGTMLAAGAHADVQRRLGALGVQRTLGFTPGRIVLMQAAAAARVAVPATLAGLAVGTLAVAGPAAGLLAALNELPPGWAVLGPLAVCLVGIVALVTGAAAWPAWRAARRPPATILRGGEIEGRRGFGTGGLLGLGARFATAARGRWLATVLTIGVCAAIVALMLALAALLERLRDDPGTVGKRYQLTARLDDYMLPSVRAIPGVEAAEARWTVDASDSYRLGEPLRLVAFPGDHTRFEAPPLAAGRRVRAAGEVEVGLGLADALGLRPGSALAVQLPGGQELRLRVSGVVRALENDGRVAWMRPERLLAAERDLQEALAIRLTPGADRAAVTRRLAELGSPPQRAAAATTRNAGFLGVLAAVLRGVGAAVGLVCLYALVQALAMTARDRRGAIAVLRASGADRVTVALVLGGAAAAVAVPAAVAGVVLERLALEPLTARLAAGFASLPLALTAGQAALVIGGLLGLAAIATALVARRVMREPVVAGLREE